MSVDTTLEERLIKFTILCLNISESLPKTPIGKYYANQLIRSASSAALHYGEAKSAESKKDFIHKIKIILKELRESNINLKIIAQKPIVDSTQNCHWNNDPDSVGTRRAKKV